MEHLWSLCIEEQFYLLWPSVLVLCTWHRTGSAGRRNATRVALRPSSSPNPLFASFCYPLPSLVSITWACFTCRPTVSCSGRSALSSKDIRASSVSILAPRVARGSCRCSSSLCSACLTVRVSELLEPADRHHPQRLLHPDVDAVADTSIRSASLGRIFNYPAIAWVGRISYSLYIWQTFFLHHLSIQVFGHNGWWNTFPYQLVVYSGGRGLLVLLR